MTNNQREIIFHLSISGLLKVDGIQGYTTCKCDLLIRKKTLIAISVLIRNFMKKKLFDFLNSLNSKTEFSSLIGVLKSLQLTIYRQEKPLHAFVGYQYAIILQKYSHCALTYSKPMSITTQMHSHFFIITLFIPN